jgi:trigger factor
MDLGRFLQLTGQTAESLVAEQRTAAEQAVKVDLALRAVAESEGHDAGDEDIEQHFDDLARRFGMPADEIRDNFERAGHMLAVRSEIKKGKALEWLLASVEILDEDGNVIDRSSLELPAADEDNETDNPAESGEDGQ